MKEYDVVVIGSGPAGLSAAIFCSRASLKTLVVGMVEKSQLNIATSIQNYFGFPKGVDGPVLIERGALQAKEFGAKFIEDEVVTASNAGGRFVIKTSKGLDIEAITIIIATGTPIRLSGIKNEEKFVGKKLHYCITCDGPLYKDKKIAIIGNTDHAAEEAIEALSYTKDITIISNNSKFAFSDNYKKEIKQHGIKLLNERVNEVKGSRFLESLILKNGKSVKFDGVFMASGIAGALDFAFNLGLETKNDLIVINENNMTSVDGVFAAGNCTGKTRQVAKNVGDGCNAAINVIKYLRSSTSYSDYVHKEEPKQGKKKRKLRMGWFSFSCCEDSTIVFTELLNDHYDEWKNLIDIRYARVLKKKNDIKNLDVAFVEGAISTNKGAQKLKEIRSNCKKLVAIGSCAVSGLPSGQRNTFDSMKKKVIEPVIRAFDYNKKVMALEELVKVDDKVPGCPMNEELFLSVLNKYIKEFVYA